MKKIFKFTIRYFTPEGGFYKEARVKWEIRELNNYPNMNDVVAKVRGLQQCGGQMGMPGNIDDNFIGLILIIPEKGPTKLLNFTE
jgi:hypothetical protein